MLKVIRVITPDKFKIDKSRLSLYFDKFQYRLSLNMSAIHYFRYIKNNSDYDSRVISLREHLSSGSDKNWNGFVYQPFGASRSFATISDNLPSIEAYSLWRETISVPTDVMIRIQCDKLDVYSNKMSIFQSLLDKLDSVNDFLDVKFLKSKPMKNFEKGIVYRENPKYKFRIYLSCELRTIEQIKQFNDTLLRYDINLSKSLISWIDSSEVMAEKSPFSTTPGTWSWPHFSFDFNDESIITILCLQHQEWIGKVCHIEKKINT